MRKCLVETVDDKGKCKQYGSEHCDWNTDAIVECAYIQGRDVDLTRWVPT